MFANEVTQTLSYRLDNLTDQEIKEVDRSTTRRVLNVLESFIRIYQPGTNVYEVSETYELRIAQKLLMSPYFDKKIRGVADFKDIFIRVDNRQRYSEHEIRQNDLPVCRFLEMQRVSHWILETKILEYIFIENPHSELIKRSLELVYIRALDKENPLQESIIEAMWKCATEKHEDIIRASLGIFEQTVAFFQLEGLAALYSHLKLLPNAQYDDMRVDFLKKYTEGALAALQKHRNLLRAQAQGSKQVQQAQSTSSTLKNFFGGKNKKNEKDPGHLIDASKYLDLNKFWQLSQDTNETVPFKTR